MDDKYTIINKCMDGINLVGFTIKKGDNQGKLISYSDAVSFARQGKLSNAEAVLDTIDNEYKIIVKDGFNSIDTIQKQGNAKVTPVSRMVSAERRQCVGYTIKDEDNNTFKVTADKFWTLASIGNVIGVQGKIEKGKRVLLSENDMLASLPKMMV